MQEDIRRSILFLINGFGIDRKDIYDVLNDNNVPNLNKLARENIYSKINNIATDYKTGYRLLSTSQKTLPGLKKVDKDIMDNFETNDKFNDLITRISGTPNKLHVFCYLDNDTTITHAKKLIEAIQKKDIKNKILLHIVFRTIKGQTYSLIEKKISNIKIIAFNNPQVELGVFFGNDMIENKIEETKELYRMLITEVGEKWPDFVRKIDILNQKKIKPGLVKPFFVNSGFKLTEGDHILLLNYDFVDYSNFVDIVLNPKNHFALSNLPANVNVYSLFPLKAKVNVESIYNIEPSNNYLTKYMESLNSKALVLTEQERINDINNSFNGLQSVKSDRLDFMLLQENMPIPNIITNQNYQLLIFDYDISKVNSMEELISELKKIDSVLGRVATECKKYDYTLFVSSLYGIEKQWDRSNNQIYTINYTESAPLIIADRLVVRGKNFVNEGNTLSLLPTVCKNMNNKLAVNSLITSKSGGGLFSLFGK